MAARSWSLGWWSIVGNVLGATRRQAGRGPATRRSAALPFNVVVVLIDTLRADHLGAYGYDRPTSPNFDALAHEATLFERATAQAPWTKPSVASLMTGAFVHHHGVDLEPRRARPDDAPTLAEAMRAARLSHGGLLRQPVDHARVPLRPGFDEFESGRAMGPQLTNLYRPPARAPTAARRLGLTAIWPAGVLGRRAATSATRERDRPLTDAAVGWIGQQTSRTPFFLYVHLIGPHDPVRPAGRRTRARSASRTGTGTGADQAAGAGADRSSTAPRRWTTPDGPRLIAQYDGAIAFADEQLGRLVEALARAAVSSTARCWW